MPVFQITAIHPGQRIKRTTAVVAADMPTARQLIAGGAGNVLAEVPASVEEVADALTLLALMDEYRNQAIPNGIGVAPYGLIQMANPPPPTWLGGAFSRVRPNDIGNLGNLGNLGTYSMEAVTPDNRPATTDELARLKRERAAGKAGHFVKEFRALCAKYGVEMRGNPTSFRAFIGGHPFKRIWVQGDQGSFELEP